jgi:cytochrome c5
MKNIAVFLTFIVTVVFLFGFTYSLNEYSEPDGKKIFVDKKCTMCHSVTSQDITSKKKDAVDISNTGANGDAAFMIKYLNKKEKIDGKVHKTVLKATEEETKALTEWLAGLKTEKTDKK